MTIPAAVALAIVLAAGPARAAKRARGRAATPVTAPRVAEAAAPEEVLRAAVPPAPAPAPPPPVDLPRATPALSLAGASAHAPPAGFVAVGGARTALRIGGFLKLDAIHDTGPPSGDASDLPNLALRGQDGADSRRGLTRLHARESRVALGMWTPTRAGPLATLLEVDFFGAAGSNAYGLRMRHAYLSWRSLLVGHTFSNFLDLDARGTTIEFNGPTAAGNRKRPQLRVSLPLAPPLSLALALENGATDYTDPTGRRVTAADLLVAEGSAVVQQLPDLTGQLRYFIGDSHLALRGMARQLRVIGPNRHLYASYGYGVAASGRWAPYGRSNAFFQATGGYGLGGYVDDLDGQAATFSASGRTFIPQLGYAALLGLERYLPLNLRTNLIASVSGVRLPPSAPRPGDGATAPEIWPISTRFLQLFVNLIHAPLPDLLIGLEYGYYRRETNSPLVGYTHRIQLGVLFRFGG